MRKALWLLLFGLGLVTVLMTYAFWTGPRMEQQPSVQTFRAVLPPSPTNSVPLQSYVVPAPTTEEAGKLANPLPDTAENRERGRVYYGYYCLQCHGQAADGAGQVGRSYAPAPANLRTAAPRIQPDGELLRRMLTGIGHAPVLERAVPPAHRWHLVLYLRHLETEPAP